MTNAIFFAFLWNVLITIFILIGFYFISFFDLFIQKFLKYLIAVTAWIILWIIFFGFFPEISINIKNFYVFVLIWVLLFYFVEIVLHFHHCHDLEDKENKKDLHDSHYNLMFLWTFLHNFLHWLELVSSFAISINAWILLTFVIIMHSLPQNIANYIIQKDKKPILIASFWWVFSALLLFLPFFGELVVSYKYYVLAITSWWLLYLSLSDIIPQINHKTSSSKEKVLIFGFIILWITLNLLLSFLVKYFFTVD